MLVSQRVCAQNRQHACYTTCPSHTKRKLSTSQNERERLCTHTHKAHSFWYVPCYSDVGQLIAYPLARILLKSFQWLSLLPLLAYTHLFSCCTHTIRRVLQHFFRPKLLFQGCHLLYTCYARTSKKNKQ